MAEKVYKLCLRDDGNGGHSLERCLAEELKAENGRLMEALQGAEWIIQRLAPHEAMAVLARGYQVSEEDVAKGQHYRALIRAALPKEEAPDA